MVVKYFHISWIALRHNGPFSLHFSHSISDSSHSGSDYVHLISFPKASALGGFQL